MGSEEEARREAEQAATDDRLGKLAETLGASVSAQAVFGEPVERDGVTVIPVARVRYGFGGGSGRGGGRRRGKKDDATGAEEQYGSGAGGGVQAGPVGYIEVRAGRARFTRIGGPARTLLVAAPLAAAALAAAVVFVLRGGLRSP